MVLDGKLIFAQSSRRHQRRRNGDRKSANGLAPAVVQRIVDSVNER
jgi:hypothetical protein